MNNDNCTRASSQEILYKNIAIAAIKHLKDEENKKYKKNILHNTEMLLRRYFDIADSMKTAKYKFAVGNEELIIRSIMRSRTTSAIMINHLKCCMEQLQQKYPQKAKIIHIMYFDENYRDATWEDKIADIVDMSVKLFGTEVSESTVTRWRKDMVSELSVILFGVDGLRLFTM
jgi:hypothetical protein